jgi:hypothetical protein
MNQHITLKQKQELALSTEDAAIIENAGSAILELESYIKQELRTSSAGA